MTTVFVDTGFWIALRDRKDEHHPAAQRLAAHLMKHRMRLVITPFVFGEAHAYFSRSRPLRETIIRDCWENPVVRVEQPTYEDQEHAIDILRSFADKTFSFCDAVSFALITRLQIEQAISFDDHFRQFGQFEVIDANSI